MRSRTASARVYVGAFATGMNASEGARMFTNPRFKHLAMAARGGGLVARRFRFATPSA